MMTLVAPWSEAEPNALFRWMVPASVVLHVVAFAWLPSASRSVVQGPPPPLVLEVAPLPPPPSPPEPPKEAEPAPAPVAARAPLPSKAPRANASSSASTRELESHASVSEAPIDFTSTVFSNDGPGLAVGGGGPTAGPRAAQASSRAASSAPPPLRLVPPSLLSRRPRAPGLDTELERQYPAEARRSGIAGSAVLRVRILPDGRVGETRVISESWLGFGPACERTVRAARWEPPLDRGGMPVATEITYTCRFEVRS